MPWTPGNIITILVVSFVGALAALGLATLLLGRDAASLLFLVLLSLTLVFSVVGLIRWWRGPRQVAPTAAGLFPVLTHQVHGRLVVVNPNTAPGPTTTVGPAGQVDLGGVFDPLHLLAASREGRLVQAAAALAQPGGGLADGVRTAAAARLLAPAPPAADYPLPPVRVSTVEPEHVRRLLIAAGELDDSRE